MAAPGPVAKKQKTSVTTYDDFSKYVYDYMPSNTRMVENMLQRCPSVSVTSRMMRLTTMKRTTMGTTVMNRWLSSGGGRARD